MVFYNNVRTLLTPSTFEIRIPPALTSQYTSPRGVLQPDGFLKCVYEIKPNMLHLELNFIGFYQHSVDCLDQIVEIERNAGPGATYPMILKSMGGRGNTASRPRSSPPPSIHPSAMSTASRITAVSKALPVKPKFTPFYIPLTGWCVQTPDRMYTMLFNDGVQVIVDPKTQRMRYYGEEMEGVWYVIDPDLPMAIKARLAHFPKFYKKFCRD